MDPHTSVEERVEESALHLLRTKGPRSVTVEAVAKDSGVAKTTIYRRYRNRQDLLTSALSRVAALAPPDPDTTPPDRVRWVIRHAVEMVEKGVGLGGVAAMLTDDDPEFTALSRQILITQRAQLSAAIDAGTADGSLRADIDSATLIDAVVGAYIAEQARSERAAPNWEERLFDFFWPAVGNP